MKDIEYKVVELSQVTDESIQNTLNIWVKEGWILENIHFAMRDSSKRPSMAFVLFTKEKDIED